MPSAKTLLRSFAGGEITPEMYGRLDNVKFQTGLALGRNGIVLPHGPFTKRPGFGYVRAAGDSTKRVRIIRFAFSADQTMVLEFGHLYLRFHTLGATLLAGSPAAYNGATAYVLGDLISSGGTNYYCVAPTTGNAPPNVTYWYALPSAAYQIPTPYTESDLFNIRYAQSNDVITLTCAGTSMRELRRLGATRWTLTAPVLGSSPPAPTVPGAATGGPGGGTPKNYFYKVTAVSEDGYEESLPTSAVTAAMDLSVAGNAITVSWTAPAGLSNPSYRVYKTVGTTGRLYGFMGETVGLNLVDDNITPDYSRSPPTTVIRLDTAGNYPVAVTYNEQRRVFGGTANNPQGIYMTRTATETNLAVTVPSSSEDAISFTIKATEQNAIRHLAPLNDLMAFTVNGVWRVASDGALLPAAVRPKMQTTYGASIVTPALTGNSCLYVETNGRKVRDVNYSWEAQSYTSDDRSIMAPHLFMGYTIVDAAFAKSPDQVYWAVRSDGALLSMTYVPEHQVFGWCRHDTDGSFESVCTVTENNEDVLYAVVLRTINGASVRHIERLASRQFATQADQFFVDAGATYSGAAATVITGLAHLEGESVVALADGAVVTDLTVTGGQVTLPTAASKVHIGLHYESDMQLLPLSVEGAPAGGQGTTKSVSYAYLRAYQTGLLKAGPSFESLREVPARTNEPYDSPPRLINRTVDILIDPDISDDAQLCVRSDTPTAMTISSIALKVLISA